MSLSYNKPHNVIAIHTKTSSENRKKADTVNHLKKITIHDLPLAANSLPRFNRKNMFYGNRNNSLKKPQTELSQTNYSTFSKKPLKKLNLSQSKSSENRKKSLENKKGSTSTRIISYDVPKSNTVEDEIFEPNKDDLSKIVEENNLTEVLPTEFSEVVVQELPCPKLFNNPKFAKKISIESNHENSTRTSSAYLGGKILQNSDFVYEKAIMKNLNFLVTNRDTGIYFFNYEWVFR